MRDSSGQLVKPREGLPKRSVGYLRNTTIEVRRWDDICEAIQSAITTTLNRTGVQDPKERRRLTIKCLDSVRLCASDDRLWGKI